MPLCAAVSEQVPGFRIVMVAAPALLTSGCTWIVQTDAEFDVSVTASPELAVAATAFEVDPSVTFAGCSNVIDCDCLNWASTVRLEVTLDSVRAAFAPPSDQA